MFDFIGNALSNSLGKNAAAPEQEERQNPFPRGPQRFRTVTNGQLRRAQVRHAAAQKRKVNRRYRRDWMRNERALNTLQQQWTIATAEAGRFPAAMVDNVVRHLEVAYGSVTGAGAHLLNLRMERK